MLLLCELEEKSLDSELLRLLRLGVVLFLTELSLFSLSI